MYFKRSLGYQKYSLMHSDDNNNNQILTEVRTGIHI